ncbi:hypothetical protein E4188_23890 (plasmid) [Aeromonas media]|uniref:Type II/III secretion system secretin-like domain-containing protein n=2 Tax=Aeromonas TaxID=642 RepID=A0ABX6NYT1_AERME|nr:MULTISPECIES: hypothetical protein [Aeromonas]ASI21437.1 hypothetical protein CE456_00910 [Aeromonas salmonicida]QJT41534.1 hypothetical protein E4188_23890 [Aeromonas media]QLI59065.1 hypothetical protein C0708_23240 [Aeromonas caviae]QLI60293.1 hypothetical protein C1C91_22890 [Aeromonas caviae]HDN9373738.1 hypothetical protein [Aeromonas salmonicida]
MKSRSAIATAVIIALSGCGAMDHLEQKNAANDTMDQIKTYEGKKESSKSVYIDKPPLDLNPTIGEGAPWWVRKPATIQGQDIPLSFAVRNLLQSANQKIAVNYGPDVVQDKIISVDYQGDINGALNEIAAKADISVSVHGNKISFERYVTKVFELNSLLGKSSFLFGRKANSVNNSGEGLANRTVTSSLGNSDTYATTEVVDINPFDDYLAAIESILRRDGVSKDDKEPLEGNVIVTSSTASILVRTTPHRMSLVESYISSRKQAIARQVMIEVKVLQFKGSKGSVFGIDWNVIRSVSEGKLQFAGPSLPTLGDTGNYGFSFTSTNPKWDGTTVLMKSLQTQGHVGVEYEPRTVARNNRVASIDNSEKLTYIARVTVTPNENADASVEVEDAVVSDGLTMSVMPNISDDMVNLQISGVLSKVIKWEETEVSGVTIRAPQVQEIKFDQDIGLKYGETLVLNGYKQKSNKSDETSVFKNSFLGGNSGESSMTETIVLITPKRI